MGDTHGDDGAAPTGGPDSCSCGVPHGCCLTSDPATGLTYSLGGERTPAHDDPRSIEAAQREPER